MNWSDFKTSVFSCPADNYGRIETLRDIFMTEFAVPHKWFYRLSKNEPWVSGESNDLQTMINIRTMDRANENYEKTKLIAKQTTQCFTPSACYSCKKKGEEVLLHKLPILQLDFDKLFDYDLREVQAAIFDLPFVCYVGQSFSGHGLVAYILIEEPDRLEAYAEHCFVVFDKHGLPVDTTKGRNYTDLRFVSYDARMLWRDEPAALKIKRFNTRKVVAKQQPSTKVFNSNNSVLNWAVREVQNAQVGDRFKTVRKVAYTLGGYGFGLNEIKSAINYCTQYAGVECKYLTHADEGFEAGKLNPIIK